jgi:hypothetical protein
VLQDGVLVTLGGCHLLDGLVDCGSVEARKEIVCSSREGFVRGIVLALRGSRRATLVERVIELPHLRVVSWCARSGQRLESLAQESSRCWSTQQGLAWWQPSEPRFKNHRVNIIYSSRWFALLSHKLCVYIITYHCVCVVALVIRSLCSSLVAFLLCSYK